MSRYLRRRDEEQHASNLELFYDLVFVLAVTQISHLLLGDLTWDGAGKAALVLLVVWWAWNYTTWVTNVLDPEAVPVRLLVLGIMFASLVMAVAIPGAFGDRALLFAGAYVAIQIGRHAFLTFVVAGRDSQEREPALHILIWFCAAGVFWLAGAFASGSAQIALWLVALAIDYSAPLVPLPGARASEARSHRVGCGDVALRRAVPAVRDHRARRVDRRHGRDDVPALARRRERRRLRRRVPDHCGVLVALLQLRRRDRPAAARARGRADDDGARRLHVPPRRARRRHDRLGRGRRDRDRASDGDAAHSGARRGRRRPRHLSRRPCPVPTGDGGLDEREAGRRRRRLRRRRVSRPRDSRARRGGAAARSCSSRSSSPSTSPARRRRQRGEPSPLQQLEAATEPSAQRAG